MTPFFWLKENSKFEVETEIKKSSIPDAGNGRFILEHVKKGQFIRKLKIINVKEYIDILKQNENDDTNYFIIFTNYDDLDLLVQYFKSFNLLDEDEIKLKISWFIASINDKLYIQSHSSYYNHSNNNNNIKYNFDDNYAYQYANKDIDKNSELFINYNDYNMPEYYLKWCNDNNIQDILSFL